MHEAQKGSGRRARMQNSIRQVRKARGLSMDALAKEVGVHFTTIAKIEKRERGCSSETLSDIARALQVTVDDLLKNPETPAVNTKMLNARNEKGMTLQQVASAVGVTAGNISRIEKLVQTPRTELATALSEVLGISTADVMGLTEIETAHADNDDMIRMTGVNDATAGPLHKEAMAMRGEVADVASIVALLPSLDDRDATLAAAVALGLPVWTERGRIEHQLGTKVAKALGVVEKAVTSGSPRLYRMTAAADPIASILLGAALRSPWAGDETVAMLEQAMTYHRTQRDAYGLLLHLQRAAS